MMSGGESIVGTREIRFREAQAKMLGHTTLLMLMTLYYRYIPNLTRQDGSLLAWQLGRQRGTGR